MIALASCVLAIQLQLVLGQSTPPRGNVSLSVLGNQQELVGDYCPGTVDLNCTGVGLTVLRWSYNENIEVYQFLTDADTVVTALIPPFVSVELINVTTTRASHVADFSSVLIADLSQLEQLNVTNIRCGDPSVSKTLLVNITIIDESVPEDPQIIEVNITQNVLSILLSVYWEQQDEVCNGYNERINYTLTVSSNSTNTSKAVNGRFCALHCSITFTVQHGFDMEENYTVYLQAVNSLGMSNTTVRHGTIAALIECPAPQPPLNGSVGNNLTVYPIGTTVTYQCDLYPNDIKTAMCRNVSGRSEWIPDPSNVDCKESKDNCNAVLPELEHGSFHIIENTSMGVTLHFQCYNGFSLSGPNYITCTIAGGWNEEPESVKCTVATPVIALVIAVVGGVGTGCLTVAFFVLVGVVIKCAYSRCQKQERRANKQTDGDMDVYSRLNHHGNESLIQNQVSDLVPDNGELYDRIELPQPKNSKPLKYAEVSTHLEDESTMSTHELPPPWPVVNYVTVDIETSEKFAASMPEPVEKEVDKAFEVDKLLNLDQALVQLRAVHNKWREIGAALHIPDTYIGEVGSYYPDDDTAAMTEMLDYWIRDCCWTHTWRELAGVLSKVGEMALAQQLMQIYETGQLPTQFDFTEVPNAMYKGRNSPPPPLPARSPSLSSNQLTMSVQSSIDTPPRLPPKSFSLKNQAKV